MSEDVLARLDAIIKQRRRAASDASYTRQLLDAGTETCARKFSEEAIETVIAAVGKADAAALANEAADVIYHLMVLLETRGLGWSDVSSLLAARMGTSGLAEKAARREMKG